MSPVVEQQRGGPRPTCSLSTSGRPVHSSARLHGLLPSARYPSQSGPGIRDFVESRASVRALAHGATCCEPTRAHERRRCRGALERLLASATRPGLATVEFVSSAPRPSPHAHPSWRHEPAAFGAPRGDRIAEGNGLRHRPRTSSTCRDRLRPGYYAYICGVLTPTARPFGSGDPFRSRVAARRRSTKRHTRIYGALRAFRGGSRGRRAAQEPRLLEAWTSGTAGGPARRRVHAERPYG